MQLNNYNSTGIKHLGSLIEMHWMVYFIRFDLACALNNYIKASSMIERSICLRRIYLIEVAALSQLYGYNQTAKHRSIWVKLNQIPEFLSSSLSKGIENELKEYTNNLDSLKRNLYTHFREEEQLNLSNRWNAFKNMNQAKELVQLNKLVVLCNKINTFLKSILSSINENQSIKSRERMKPILKMRELGIKSKNKEIVDMSEKLISLFEFTKKK